MNALDPHTTEPAHPYTLAHLLRAAAARLLAAGCAEARLDAELLLAAACDRSRAWLAAHGGDTPSEAEAQHFAGLVARRAQHEPVAYILGRKEFYGLDLLVDRRVLIPRPETETLVDEALAWLRRASGAHLRAVDSREPAGPAAAGAAQAAHGPAPAAHGPGPAKSVSDTAQLTRALPLTVIDLGTGSGALALALAAHTPPETVRFIALDLSSDALAVARANAVKLGLGERVTFMQSDLLAAVDLRADLIVANLPYVARAEWAALAPDIDAYEPHLALDGGADGLDLYRRLFTQAPTRLAPNGALLLEIGWQQGAAVRALALAAFPRAQVRILPDLAGQDRVAAIDTNRLS